jgi:copper(I)-binding protein
MKKQFFILLLPLFVFSCTPGEQAETPSQIDAEGIHIEGAWARPGAEGRMSAGYFLITNYAAVDDTLISVHSDAARLTEVHESYDRGDGMMGMREVPELIVPAGETVRFEQGGLHIMFIQLTKTLEDGEEIELTLNFAQDGEKQLVIAVRL